MGSMSTIVLSGHSGSSYAFEVFALDAELPPVPVVYVVFQQALSGSDPQSRRAVYVGQARDAAAYMGDHHRQCYLANGATHIALHVDYDDGIRVQKVDDLVRALSPVCNG